MYTFNDDFYYYELKDYSAPYDLLEADAKVAPILPLALSSHREQGFE